jgi:hypothetical protein
MAGGQIVPILYLSLAAGLAASVSYIIARPIGGLVRNVVALFAGSLVAIVVLVVAIIGIEPSDKPSPALLVLICLAGALIGAIYARHRRTTN